MAVASALQKISATWLFFMSISNALIFRFTSILYVYLLHIKGKDILLLSSIN